MDVTGSPAQATTASSEEREEARIPTLLETDSSISAVTMRKLPPFWKENPVLWFAQVEAMFSLSRISNEDTKYGHIIANLEPSILPFISDVVRNPPPRGKYELIKNKLITAFDESDESRVHRVLRNCTLGSDKPSHFLHKLKNLGGNHISEAVLRSIFLEQMPENLRDILIVSEVKDLARLALQADKISEMRTNNFNVAAVSTPLNHSTNSIDNLQEQVNQLTKMIEALSSRQARSEIRRPSSWRRRSQSRNNRNRRRSSSRENTDGLCYYHRRFSDQARHCTSPCTWTGQL